MYATSMHANRRVHVKFQPTFENKEILLNTLYRSSLGDSLQLSTFRWYISHVQLRHQHQVVSVYPKQAILMDLADRSSLQFEITVDDSVQFNEIQFGVGIDSVTNDAGVHGGDLDPTKGMYWAWQSGYINLKLEGSFSSAKHSPTKFEFHLGGFLAPFNAYQTARIPVHSADSLILNWRFDSFFSTSECMQHAHIMSPGSVAVKMSEFLASQFSCL